MAAVTGTYNDGYPMKKINGKMYRMHRLALAEKLGRPIAKGMYALHTCHNRWCVNTNHLYEGTHEDNMIDMVRSGRSARCGSSRKLTEDQVVEVLARLAAGETGRSLAQEFGVNDAQISRIKHGKSYRTAPGLGPTVTSGRVGEPHPPAGKRV